MRKRIVTACLLLFSFTALYSQSLKEYSAFTAGGTGNDSANAVAVDLQGNVYLAGGFNSTVMTIGAVTLANAGGTDAFLVKIDTFGNVVWAKRFGGVANENISALKVDPNGFIFATGRNFPLVKLDNNGNVLWQDVNPSNQPFTTIAIDSRNNVYEGDYSGFRKYRSSGTFIYAKAVPGSSGEFSLDWSDNAHVFFHGSGTLVNGTQSFNVNLATRIVYDSAGQIISVQQVSTIPRWYPEGYKAVGVNEYYATAFYPTLNATTVYMALGRNITGANVNYGNCVYKWPVNPTTDGAANEFYTGNLSSAFSACWPPGSIPPPPVLAITSTNQINTVTGNDIFYIHRVVNKDSGSTTYDNGRTNETAVRTAVDSIRKIVYIAGYWSKIADTSKFRFGSKVLTNAGNGTSTDVLLLALKYSPSPLTANGGLDKTVCLGGSALIGNFASGGTGSYAYRWSPATGLTDTAIATPTAKPTVTTTYVVSVTDGTGTTARDTVKVIVDSSLYKPTVTLAVGSNPFCEGQNIQLKASPALSHQWNNQTSVPLPSTSDLVVISKTDTVTVTTINNQGCIGTSDPFYAVMKPRTPTPTIAPAGNAQNTVAACVGNIFSLTAQNVQSPVSYQWNTGAATPSINTQTSGTYSVTSTGANGCISLAASRNVRFYNLPAGTITATGGLNLCAGDSVQLKVNTADSVSVLWSNGATARTIWVKTAGTYSVLLTTTQGCTKAASNTVAVQVFQRPSPMIAQNANTLTVSPAAASYQWFLDGNVLNGATAQSVNILTGGSYGVTVTDANSCSASASYGAVLRVANPALTYQVYPNPAKDKIGIAYSLQQSEKVSVLIRNGEGKILQSVVDNKQQAAGDYQYAVATYSLPKGLVMVEFRIGNKRVTHKLLLL